MYTISLPDSFKTTISISGRRYKLSLFHVYLIFIHWHWHYLLVIRLRKKKVCVFRSILYVLYSRCWLYYLYKHLNGGIYQFEHFK